MSSDYQKSCASIAVLKQRSQLLQKLRQFFLEHQFIEVETPLLSADTVVDLYLDPFQVPTPHGPRYLQTSPEFAMKRLLADGMQRIFQITKAFRESELGQRHNPEFTMLEWYRVGDDYAQGRALLAQLFESLMSSDLLVSDAGSPVQSLCLQKSYAEVFQQSLNLDPFFCDLAPLMERSQQAGLQIVPSAALDRQRRECLNFLWGTLIDPELGRDQPVIVYDWPASDAALARVSPRTGPAGDFLVAERYELYFRGLELANGYHELTDPQILRERNKIANQQRRELGKPELPEDSRLLTAMENGLPPSCGVAVGVDRLLMALRNQDDISHVLAFPWDRA